MSVTLTISADNGGASGTKTWTVTNIGTVPAYVDLNISADMSQVGNLNKSLMARLFIVGGGTIYGPAAMIDMAGDYDLNS